MVEFLTFDNQRDLIRGVHLHKLTINRDPRGFLVETLKQDWPDVFRRPELQFGQSYCSVTLPGYARDEHQWHNHPTKQTDRFVVIKGNAAFALYDGRKESETFGKLNVFLMGEANGDENQYLILIPMNVYHGFCTLGEEAVYLLGFPDQSYDPAEEERIPFSESDAKFSDGTPFSWNAVRENFKNLPAR